MDYRNKIANELMRAYTEKQLEAVKDRLDKNPWAVMVDFASYCHEQLALHNVSKSVFCEDCKHTIDVRLKRNPYICVECGGRL